MSDSTRQSLGDRISAAITPDSQKKESTKLGENIRGKVDKAQAYVQPESEKSYMQKAADTIRDMAEGSNSTGLQTQRENAKEDAAYSVNEASGAHDRR